VVVGDDIRILAEIQVVKQQDSATVEETTEAKSQSNS
jgi:hypothetical protein